MPPSFYGGPIAANSIKLHRGAAPSTPGVAQDEASFKTKVWDSVCVCYAPISYNSEPTLDAVLEPGVNRYFTWVWTTRNNWSGWTAEVVLPPGESTPHIQMFGPEDVNTPATLEYGDSRFSQYTVYKGRYVNNVFQYELFYVGPSVSLAVVHTWYNPSGAHCTILPWLYSVTGYDAATGVWKPATEYVAAPGPSCTATLPSNYSPLPGGPDPIYTLESGYSSTQGPMWYYYYRVGANNPVPAVWGNSAMQAAAWYGEPSQYWTAPGYNWMMLGPHYNTGGDSETAVVYWKAPGAGLATVTITEQRLDAPAGNGFEFGTGYVSAVGQWPGSFLSTRTVPSSNLNQETVTVSQVMRGNGDAIVYYKNSLGWTYYDTSRYTITVNFDPNPVYSLASGYSSTQGPTWHYYYRVGAGSPVPAVYGSSAMQAAAWYGEPSQYWTAPWYNWMMLGPNIVTGGDSEVGVIYWKAPGPGVASVKITEQRLSDPGLGDGFEFGVGYVSAVGQWPGSFISTKYVSSSTMTQQSISINRVMQGNGDAIVYYKNALGWTYHDTARYTITINFEFSQ